MISKAVSGAGFKGAIGYVTDPAKAEHVEARGLASVKTAPKEMRAVAEQSGRVQKPVYHFTIAWAPGEQPTRDQMIQAADKMSERLGLGSCQRVYAIHNDTAHRHIHVVANRVNPDTGRAVPLSQDRWRRSEVCREIEQEQGWQAVPTPERGEKFRPVSQAEMDRQRRDGRAPFAQVTEQHAGRAFDTAQSWDDLATSLSAHGLRLETWRSGLVVTDGTERTKASAFGRQCSRQSLEQKFSESFADYQARRDADALEQAIRHNSKEISHVGPKPGVDHYNRRKFRKPGHRQPNLESASGGQAPQSGNSVPDLSSIPVALHGRNPDVLLPGHARDELDQHGAGGGPDSLRRSGAERLTRGSDGPYRRQHQADPPRERLVAEYRQQRMVESKAASAARQALWAAEAALRTQEKVALKRTQAQARSAIYGLTGRGIVRMAMLAAQSWWSKRQWAKLRRRQDERWQAEKARAAPTTPPGTFRAFLEGRAAQDRDAVRVLHQIKRTNLRSQDIGQAHPDAASTLLRALEAEARFHATSQVATDRRVPAAKREAAQAEAIAAQREALAHTRVFADWAKQHPGEASHLRDQVKRQMRDRNQAVAQGPGDFPELVGLKPQEQEPQLSPPPTLAVGAAAYDTWRTATTRAAAAARRDSMCAEAVMASIEANRLGEAWGQWAREHPRAARKIEDQAKAARVAARDGSTPKAQRSERSTPAPAPLDSEKSPSTSQTAADRWTAVPQNSPSERTELEKAVLGQVVAEIHDRRVSELRSELESGLVRRHLAGEPPDVIGRARDAILASGDPEAERRLDQVLLNERARAEREQQPGRVAEIEALRGPVTQRIKEREPPPAAKPVALPRDRATELERELTSGLVRRHLADLTVAELAKVRDGILAKGDTQAERRLDQVLTNEASRAGITPERLAQVRTIHQPVVQRVAEIDGPSHSPTGRSGRRR